MKIAFSGKISSGKDTSAEYLISQYGGQKHSFAAAIYDIMYYAQKVCGFSQEKDRKFLQMVGTEWGRSKDSDVWIKTAIRNTPLFGNVFLTDLRFPNELYALKMNGWITVRIKRTTQGDTRLGSGSHTHASETALDDTPDSEYDYVIENNGTLEELHGKLDELYDSCKERYRSNLGWSVYIHDFHDLFWRGYDTAKSHVKEGYFKHYTN